MDRDTLQTLAAQRLAEEHRLVCQWCTGAGKSNVVLKFLKAQPGMTCLILVPEQNNIENWKTEFVKFGVSMDLVSIVCYASLHKYRNTRWGLLVFDEAPHVDTVLRRDICRTIKGEYILALGAVIDPDETAVLEDLYGRFARSYVSLRLAIEWGILVSPIICICHMTLDDRQRNIQYSGRLLTMKEAYRNAEYKVSNAVTAYNSVSSKFNRNRMLRAGSERKRLLGKFKDKSMKRICDVLISQGKRFLCFCSSIKQAEELGGENAFTSRTPASMRLLDRFNNHEIDSLYVIGKLIEGQNLVDIDCGVIGQLGGTSRITVQCIGRIMRSKNPVIYLPVFDGTKDDGFLYTVTSNVPQDYIKHYKL